ncbi:hypothetical protein E0H75_42130 [Kribbella capetownensis]|uniref:DUF6879 domain-containing protein n=1 Tax=Kribbella capetownensis TaxID=1572659 RepID=A0A4R0IK41_9ACTN|nr:DUF6879 family protein [Kribbella capetownensis]TCC33861.1 hypothetical protein E0H75_42130 [Kribbella capetownensis]
MTLVDAFQNFQHSAFRLETLPTYDVPDEAAELEAYRDGRPLAERSVRTMPWLAQMAATTAEGKQWQRLRLIGATPTLYESWEVGRYVESQACGEQIRLLDRAEHPELAGHQDFWLFDAGTPTAVGYLMRYDEHGAFHGTDQAPADQLADLAAVIELWRTAPTLNNYLTTFEAARSAQQMSA